MVERLAIFSPIYLCEYVADRERFFRRNMLTLDLKTDCYKKFELFMRFAFLYFDRNATQNEDWKFTYSSLNYIPMDKSFVNLGPSS